MSSVLPPGQVETDSFPRFGLSQYANRFPTETNKKVIKIRLKGRTIHSLNDDLAGLQRVEQTSDFHCVTTWTKRGIHWRGVRFKDLYETIVAPEQGKETPGFVVFRAQDGYRVGMLLTDLLQPEVLLADEMNGEPLSVAHGAPLRLIMPAHYGYKNPKHVSSIDFLLDSADYRPVGLKFMDHPRARVEFEERGRILPGWLLRVLYRPLIKSTSSTFQRALDDHEQGQL